MKFQRQVICMDYYDYDAWEREQSMIEDRESYQDYLADESDLECMES